jgi:hypothetical protein
MIMDISCFVRLDIFIAVNVSDQLHSRSSDFYLASYQLKSCRDKHNLTETWGFLQPPRRQYLKLSLYA